MPRQAAKKYGYQLVLAFNPDQTISNHIRGIEAASAEWADRCAKLIIPGGISHEDELAAFVDRHFSGIPNQAKANPNGGRVYVMGHGNWKQCTIGGYSPALVARAIRATTDGHKVRLVSVLGCKLGRDSDGIDEDARTVLVTTSCNSFAAQLHRMLQDVCDLLYARVFGVNVAQANGVKSTGERGNLSQRRRASQLKFSWDGDTQTRAYVDYASAAAADFNAGWEARISELERADFDRFFL
jgi:hypothetical protein